MPILKFLPELNETVRICVSYSTKFYISTEEKNSYLYSFNR